MSGRDRDDGGRFTAAMSLDDVYEYVREQGNVTTTEVAEHWGVSSETARRKLRELEEEDRVIARDVGSALLWMADE
ncbi:DeoR family transcriptional regulator [Halalkalicoccus jeotgali]|uniref:HTH deoR-type domain-containing protein n=1 Tax=Halalkalicoccus jeotgali (strain DSM 18796 / CECT 7217 / JCM 14584 / KCTC 4019 / B3) TaxID=795797 RepID=D8J9M5_HALJB|nr:DeoR family transcriptional regulator [Halalkalicoccus jeotgali]ADJ14437.1 hypothetical protein HacjB3_05230 [Halalkalicoccus jeotgali B3]ELY40153.1 hypothetical protein C497_03615 [Halalkalicoccus jeotgali B3]